MQTAIIDKSNQVIIARYSGLAHQADFGGANGNPDLTVHVSTELEIDTCDVSVDAEDNFSLVQNADKLKAWKQGQNQIAQTNFANQKSAECETQVQQILGDEDDVTHLMLACANFLTYLESLQAAANITDAALGTDGQGAKAALTDMRDTLMTNIQIARGQRDDAIAAFTPPNTDVDPLYPTE